MAESAHVRRTVRRLLEAAPAWAALPPEKRRQIARDTVRVATYLADPHGLVSAEARRPVLTRRPARRAAARTRAPVLRDGVGAVLAELSSVTFPTFVGGLIQGVFNAIVQATIQQMEAYAKLVADVAASVDTFMTDGLTDGHARDDLASRFPDLLCLDAGTRRRLRWAGCADTGARVLQAALDLPDPPADLRHLVTAARRRLAVQRQQMLATLVLLGINRIVVNDTGTAKATARPAARRGSRSAAGR